MIACAVTPSILILSLHRVLTTGLLFLRSRLRGVSSFRWRNLLPFSVLGLLPGYIIRLHFYAWFLFALPWFTTTRSYEFCFFFLFLLFLFLFVFAYLLAFPLACTLYLISSSVLKAWSVHWSYTSTYNLNYIFPPCFSSALAFAANRGFL